MFWYVAGNYYLLLFDDVFQVFLVRSILDKIRLTIT